jgi:hypothetical protein
VSFFDHAHGTGEISIRLIDNRRSTQAFADASSFNAVRFELRNVSKLKTPRVKGVGATGATYGSVFTGLPSDDQARYVLTVDLFSGISDPSDPADSGYANLDRKVGEGVSAAFTVAAGASKTITVVINAVGEIGFGSGATAIDNANPVFTAGDATAKGLIKLSASVNPLATALKYYVVGANEATQSTATLAPGTWLAPPIDTPLPFTAPATAGTYRLVADMVNGDQVLSRRTRSFSVAAVPSVASVTFTGSYGSFKVNETPFMTSWHTFYSFPASGSSVELTFTNNSNEYLFFGHVDGENSYNGYVHLGYLVPSASASYSVPVRNGYVHLLIDAGP